MIGSHPQLDRGAADVWHAPLDPPAPRPEALAGWLSPPERERAARFRLDRDRRRYVTAHAFLRGVLGRYLGCGPEAVALEAAPNGKPQLAPPVALRFNLAHSGEMAIAAVARDREVGADVEWIRPLTSASTLARRLLSPRELEELGAEVGPRDLLACWTRKEAVLKASGEGLRREPAAVDVGSGSREATTLVTLARNGSAGGQWTVASLVPAAGYVAAVAAAGPGLHLRRRAWDWSST